MSSICSLPAGFTAFLFPPIYTCSEPAGTGRHTVRGTVGMCTAMKTLTLTRSLAMNLLVWLPLMFGLGLVGLVLCLLFVDACDRI